MAADFGAVVRRVDRRGGGGGAVFGAEDHSATIGAPLGPVKRDRVVLLHRHAWVDGHASRALAAVLEAPPPFDQQRPGLALPGMADAAAHGSGVLASGSEQEPRVGGKSELPEKLELVEEQSGRVVREEHCAASLAVAAALEAFGRGRHRCAPVLVQRIESAAIAHHGGSLPRELMASRPPRGGRRVPRAERLSRSRPESLSSRLGGDAASFRVTTWGHGKSDERGVPVARATLRHRVSVRESVVRAQRLAGDR